MPVALSSPASGLCFPSPFPHLPLPSDPWDPGVTAQDLLFRGGFHYRRQPQVVLDVTEQVSGPTA